MGSPKGWTVHWSNVCVRCWLIQSFLPDSGLRLCQWMYISGITVPPKHYKGSPLMKHAAVSSQIYIRSLCIFGCSAYAMCIKLRDANLDPNTRKCVLLDYGTNQKGYCLYNLGWMKVIHSRGLIFNETSMPGIQKEEKPTVELWFEEESGVKEATTINPSESVAEKITLDEQLGE